MSCTWRATSAKLSTRVPMLLRKLPGKPTTAISPTLLPGALAMTIYPPKYDDYAPAESTDAAPRINPRARLGSQAEEPMNAVPPEHLIGTPPTRELNVSNHLIGTPPMRERSVSNHLLGNRAALDAAWDRDGYWFFRDVLD